MWRDAPLRALVLFVAVANFGAGALAGVFVLVVQDHFGVPEALFGVFLAVAAVGAIIGAALSARAGERFGRFPVMVVGFLGQTALCLVFAFAPNPWVAALAWSALAGASTLAGVLGAGMVQLVVPEHLMGRVLSAKKVLSFSLLPLGTLAGGLLGRVDLRAPAVFGAVVFVVATVWVWGSLRVMAARADEAERVARRSEPVEE